MLFLANFDPSSPLSHFVTHPGTPKSTSHISDPAPRFLVGLVQKTQTKAPVQILSHLFVGAFVGGFCQGVFCPFPLLSEYICYNRKLKITLNFMFHMYDKKIYKRDVTRACPLPPSQTVTPSRTPSPLERDVLYGRPPILNMCIILSAKH